MEEENDEGDNEHGDNEDEEGGGERGEEPRWNLRPKKAVSYAETPLKWRRKI